MKKNTEADRERVFREYPVAKALRVMVVPAVVSQLIVLIYNMADTFYVGLTDNPYMIAGTSLILPVFNISLCLAGLAGVGGGALISRLLGQGREDEARRASVFSLYLAVFIAAAFAVGTGVFMDPLLKLLGAGENTYEYARQYALCVIVCGGVPTVLSNALANVVRSVGRSKEAGAGIVLEVERFPLNVGVGICQGMLPLVAYSYGAGNHRRMNDTIRLARRVGLLIAAVSIVLYEIFAGPLVRIFLSDAQAVEMASGFLRIRVLATPLMFLSFFTVYLFQAFGRGRISLFLGVMRWLVFNIPMLFILNHFFGMYGIVWSQVVADSLTVLLSFYVLRRFGPKKEAVS